MYSTYQIAKKINGNKLYRVMAGSLWLTNNSARLVPLNACLSYYWRWKCRGLFSIKCRRCLDLYCRFFAGRIIALGVGNLQRAVSEAVLVETAEPINCDTESGALFLFAASLVRISFDISLELKTGRLNFDRGTTLKKLNWKEIDMNSYVQQELTTRQYLKSGKFFFSSKNFW